MKNLVVNLCQHLCLAKSQLIASEGSTTKTHLRRKEKRGESH